uniref:BZIP domain-containing protein n=1 Tax=Arion vulgaris TaxID=1028688 RepID=A0A0B7BD01_9EUPU
MTVNSFKKPISSTKMDIYVPSPDYTHFSMGSPSSIYDHDRPHLNSLCGSCMISNISMDSVVSDELCGLDDNLEDGSIETYFTPDVMNSFEATLNSLSEFPWADKLEHDVAMPSIRDSLSPNPTLAQLDMEPDISFLNDIISADQEDSKLNYSTLDLCSDMNDFINTSVYTTISNSSPVSVPSLAVTSADLKKESQAVMSLNDLNIEQKSLSNVENNVNKAGVVNRVPARESQPQLIGIATVIKPELVESFTTADDNLSKLKTQSPNLHKLLSCKQPLSDIKTENSWSTSAIKEEGPFKMFPTDISAQIVPSSTAPKRTHTGIIKTEPMSPKAETRSIIKEETTEDKWKDIEHFMHSPGEQSRKKRRCDSKNSEHLSDDDDEDDDDDSSLYGDKSVYMDSDDDYSDLDADLVHIVPSECESLVTTGKKQKQYFWQYNVQSKGPKGTRLKLSVESPSDPHVLNDFEDPVFDECNTAIAGIRHGGKARKGDGNEISPNPRKLVMIGHQLLRLNRQINACQLGSDVPVAKRNESRKEKNKLASRACRLKKKAQHEANKIKLYGLEKEHSQLNSVLQYIWPHILEKTKSVMGQTDKSTSLSSMMESQAKHIINSLVAGHTAEFVNGAIAKVESGDNSGGLNLRKNHKT